MHAPNPQKNVKIPQLPRHHHRPRPPFITPHRLYFHSQQERKEDQESRMGNSIGGKRKRTAKVMKIDGTTFRLKPPAQARDVLRDHRGYDLLESEEVKRLGLRAQPLHPGHPLSPGKLYFLIELPLLPDQKGAAPRRAWSGALHVSAKDRLESLKLSRRSVSDLSVSSSKPSASLEGGVRLRMRLPKAEVARVVEGSKDAAEAAEKIMQLCMAREEAAPAKRTDEKKKRFLPMPEEIIA